MEKVTLQKELLRYRKTLGTVEQDLESYKQQLNEVRHKSVRGRGEDSQQREEISKLSNALRHAEAEVQKLGERLKAAENREAATNDEQRRELVQLRQELQGAEVEIQNLNNQLRNARSNEADADRAADELDDLKAELREKERMLGEKDDQLVGAASLNMGLFLTRIKDDVKEELAALQSRTGRDTGLFEEKDAELV